MSKTLVNEPKLTIKQRKFLALYLKTGNGTKSALEVYDTDDPTVAAAISSENLRILKTPIRTFLEVNGLSLGYLTATLAEGLKANKIHTSHTEPDKVVPDHQTRHKYLETASKWLGITEPSTNQTNIQVNVPIFQVMTEEAKETLTALYKSSKQEGQE